MIPEEYVLNKKEALAYRIKISLITMGCMVLVLAAIIGWRMYHARHINNSGLIYLLIVTPVTLIISTGRMLWRQKKEVENFKLVIEEDAITQNPGQSKEVVLTRMEVRSIRKLPRNTINIMGGHENRLISIPSQVENRDRLEASLAKFGTIEVVPNTLLRKLATPLIVLIFAVFMFFIYSKDEMTVKVLGGVLLATLAACTAFVYRAKHKVPNWRKATISLLVIFLLVVARMIYLFTDLFR